MLGVFSDVPDHDRDHFCRFWEILKTEVFHPMQLERIQVQFVANTRLEMMLTDSGSACVYIHNAVNAAENLLQLTRDFLELETMKIVYLHLILPN